MDFTGNQMLSLGQELSVEGSTYRVAADPADSLRPWMVLGTQAVIYRLEAEQEPWTLKVFPAARRTPALVAHATRLAPLAAEPGLAAARRTVLTARRHTALLRAHPDLAYAVLMPWRPGPSWTEVLQARRPITPAESLTLARALAGTLTALAAAGWTHGALAADHLLLPALTPGATAAAAIELIGLDHSTGPQVAAPLPADAAPNYQYPDRPPGDRFAVALLLAELLGWTEGLVRVAAAGTGYFTPAELGQSCERSRRLDSALRGRWGADVADLFTQAWRSRDDTGCPAATAWLAVLPDQLPGTQPARPLVIGPARVAALAAPAEGSAPPQPDPLPIELLSASLPVSAAALDEGGTSTGVRHPVAVADASQIHDLAARFDAGLAAYSRSDWSAARDHLEAVVLAAPSYAGRGQRAADLRGDAERRLAPAPTRPVAAKAGRGQAAIFAAGVVGLLLFGLGFGGLRPGSPPTPLPHTSTVLAVDPRPASASGSSEAPESAAGGYTPKTAEAVRTTAAAAARVVAASGTPLAVGTHATTVVDSVSKAATYAVAATAARAAGATGTAFTLSTNATTLVDSVSKVANQTAVAAAAAPATPAAVSQATQTAGVGAAISAQQTAGAAAISVQQTATAQAARVALAAAAMRTPIVARNQPTNIRTGGIAVAVAARTQNALTGSARDNHATQTALARYQDSLATQYAQQDADRTAATQTAITEQEAQTAAYGANLTAQAVQLDQANQATAQAIYAVQTAQAAQVAQTAQAAQAARAAQTAQAAQVAQTAQAARAAQTTQALVMTRTAVAHNQAVEATQAAAAGQATQEAQQHATQTAQAGAAQAAANETAQAQATSTAQAAASSNSAGGRKHPPTTTGGGGGTPPPLPPPIGTTAPQIGH